MNELKTVNCEQLMTTPLKPIEFCVKSMLSTGLFILAGALGGVLEKQIEQFKSQHADLKIIIIDTLQKVRSGDDTSYASDYKELSVLKNLADKLRIAILLVHHTRKCRDNYPFNMISGTTGISGCVEGSIVMIEKQRGSGEVILHCVGRDIENLELHLKHKRSRWIAEEIIIPKPHDTFSFMIHDFMLEKIYFKGSTTTLINELKMQFGVKIPSNEITQNLVQHGIELKDFGVTFEVKHSCGQRLLILKYDRESDSSAGCHLWVEIAVTAVTPCHANALPTRSYDSDGTALK